MKTILINYKKVQEVITSLIGIILSIMMLVILAQTLSRYVFTFSLPWSEELTRYLFVALVVLGVNISISTDVMVRIDIIDTKLSPKARYVLDEIRNYIAIVVSVFFLVSTIYLVRIGVFQVSPSLHLPMSIIYGVVLLGYIFSIISLVLKIVENKYAYVRSEVDD